MDIRWSKLSLTAQAIASQWADRPERKPPAFRLDAIVHSVRDTWEGQKNLGALSNRELRWLPYAIFHPAAKRDAWLANDATFMVAALALGVRAPGRRRAAGQLPMIDGHALPVITSNQWLPVPEAWVQKGAAF